MPTPERPAGAVPFELSVLVRAQYRTVPADSMCVGPCGGVREASRGEVPRASQPGCLCQQCKVY